MQLTNPVIPGFHPDPSLCRVGEDYYLVTSSFEYFPGVPIFHSRDLVHWRQIGHCLTRPSQLPLARTHSSTGIFAPTLRHHDGRFYMITTNIEEGGHFLVTATDPAGEWSEPLWLPGPGFDPDLFFDDDGRVYYGYMDIIHRGIRQFELDLATGRLLSAERLIWSGFEDVYPEGPHLYKINGQYYLMVAEGGTHRGHMVVIARSASPAGPFTGCPHNPILTHRANVMGPVAATGHADLIQAHDGSWWMVFLGIRQMGMPYHHLGRETFLAPVTWDGDGWPVVNGGQWIEPVMDVPGLLPAHPWPAEAVRDDFDTPAAGPAWSLHWNWRRNPAMEHYSLSARPGWLTLTGSALTLDDAGSPTFLGRRQKHFDVQATTRLDFAPGRDGEEAGLTVFMNEAHHYEIAITREGGGRVILVRRRIGDLQAVVARAPLAGAGPVTLRVDATARTYTFSYALDGQAPQPLAAGATHYLSSEVAGGFTGVYFALYATGNGRPSQTPACFDWFDYEPKA